MKSRLHVLFIFLLCLLFLSCSNLFQAKGGKGSVAVRLPGHRENVFEQSLKCDRNSLLYEISVLNDTKLVDTTNASSGETIKFSLDPGVYSIAAVAYDSKDKNKIFPLYKGSAEAEVEEAKEKELTLVLKRVSSADFVKNVWGEEKDQYNYTWGGNIDNYYPAFDKVLKKGDCARVTFSGVANTAFSGKIDATFAKNGNQNAWTEVARASNEVSFKVGDEVTLSFDLILQDDTFDKNDIQFNLFYDFTSLDETMSFNEYKIDFNFNPDFTSIEHNIHIGDFVYPLYVKAGEQFELPSADKLNTYLLSDKWGFELEGWYRTNDFTGSKVSRVSKSDNTKTMDFYAKLNLALKKNIYAEPSENEKYYNYTAAVNLANFAKGADGSRFEKLPQSGEKIKLTVEGLASSDFNGYLACNLVEWSKEWTSFDYEKYPLNVKKGESFVVYYELTVPEDRSLLSLEDTWISLSYELEDLDVASSISDLKVTLYGDDYGSNYIIEAGQSEHMTLAYDKDGILVTVNLLFDDKHAVEAWIDDLASGSQFRINDDVVKASDSYSFVWPLCKKDEVYQLQLRTHIGNYVYVYESAYCSAGGGIGELDYSEYNNISLSLENAEDARNVVIDNFSEAAFKQLTSSSDKVSDLGFEVTLYSGFKDWHDTDWIYVYTYIFGNESEGSIYEGLAESGKFNILKDYFNWKKPSTINDELSSRELCFFGLRSYFNMEGYEDGYFYAKELLSDEIAYPPYEFPILPANVEVSIFYPDDYTPPFSINSTNTSTSSILNALLFEEIDNITYYWYIDNELIQSGPSASLEINYSDYPPKFYNAKCIATYELEQEMKVLEADYILAVTSMSL